MLNISVKSVAPLIKRETFRSYKSLDQRSHSNVVPRILLLMFALFVISLFLPWTQNIRSNGVVTTLNPFDKPQEIQALVGGQIAKWYVREGDIVTPGDTIVVLEEAKADYLDPNILENTRDQQLAKSLSADAYKVKMAYLQDEAESLVRNRESKRSQIEIKRQQLSLELASQKLELEAAKTFAQNAENQLNRMEAMYKQGIKSLTDLETRRLSNREAQARMLSIENQLLKIENELVNLDREIEIVNAEFDRNYAKVQAEIRSTDSYRYDLIGESTKLQSKYNEIERRQRSFVITSPVSGRIMKVLKNGIGEFVKEQESLATVVPLDYERAVELYIEPNDMPLIREGNQVRLQFDGWPAIVFSGWPENSFGTFGGIVNAIDNNISENGKYRILVTEDKSDKGWPELIRIGSGVRGLLLLNDVKVYYEIWRKLNGFPPDFYIGDNDKAVNKKAPLRKLK